MPVMITSPAYACICIQPNGSASLAIDISPGTAFQPIVYYAMPSCWGVEPRAREASPILGSTNSVGIVMHHTRRVTSLFGGYMEPRLTYAVPTGSVAVAGLVSPRRDWLWRDHQLTSIKLVDISGEMRFPTRRDIFRSSPAMMHGWEP